MGSVVQINWTNNSVTSSSCFKCALINSKIESTCKQGPQNSLKHPFHTSNVNIHHIWFLAGYYKDNKEFKICECFMGMAAKLRVEILELELGNNYNSTIYHCIRHIFLVNSKYFTLNSIFSKFRLCVSIFQLYDVIFQLYIFIFQLYNFISTCLFFNSMSLIFHSMSDNIWKFLR